jgi:hypothetical protein
LWNAVESSHNSTRESDKWRAAKCHTKIKLKLCEVKIKRKLLNFYL